MLSCAPFRLNRVEFVVADVGGSFCSESSQTQFFLEIPWPFSLLGPFAELLKHNPTGAQARLPWFS